MRNINWIYKSSEKVNYANFPKKYDIFLEKILKNKKISSKEESSEEESSEKEIDEFLNTKKENISNPYTLEDMEKAVTRIIKAIENMEEIWIYGDYDVDGITSTSLLYVTLEKIGAKVNFYIPLRDEGYGLNKDAIKSIGENGGNLIITVDCGVSSVEEVDYCNSLGMEIIITDHHDINNEIPRAYAVINPKRIENQYKFKYLAGVGTAFMLILAIYEKFDRKNEVYDYLDIVAVGTIADIVPLVEENRIFAKLGLQNLKNSKFLGLKMLTRKLFPDYEKRKFQGSDVGFGIAPIFNAAGRLEDAKKVVEFLIAPQGVNLNKIMIELLDQNYERKEIQNDIYEKSINLIEKENLNKNNILIFGRKDFHHGVIGIVASKVSEKYYKPTIIYEIKENENIAVASCRSIENFNITETLSKFSDYLIKYGGHWAAAGFSISLDKLDEFKKVFTDYVNEHLRKEEMVKNIKIDSQLPICKITHDFFDKLSLLEPFGPENPTPIFVMNNCTHENLRIIGKTQEHLMMNIIKGNSLIKNCSFFGGIDIFEELTKTKTIDIAFKLKVDLFKERYHVKLDIIDIKKSKSDVSDEIYESESLHNLQFPLELFVYTRKNIDEKSLLLKIENGNVIIYSNRDYIDSLNGSIAQNILKLNKYYNYKFSVTCKSTEENSENTRIHIIIDRDYSFESFALKEAAIFTDIKKFLIGDFPFNSIQKKILGSIFRDKSNVLVRMEQGRGINTIIKTIALYYKNMGLKSLLVNEFLIDTNNSLTKFIDIKDTLNTGYDYYILYNPNEKNILELRRIEKEEKEIKYLLIVDENYDVNTENKLLEKNKKIDDNYEIPSNLVIYSHEEMIEKISVKKNGNYFIPFLSIDEKYKLLEKIQKGDIIEGTKHFISYL